MPPVWEQGHGCPLLERSWLIHFEVRISSYRGEMGERYQDGLMDGLCRIISKSFKDARQSAK